MVVGIIGAGIAGLTAGRELAKAGHEVTIIEKSRGFGGRMATRYAGKNDATKLDHGASYFRAESPEFQEFTAELIEKNLIRVWGSNFSFFDGENLIDRHPNPGAATAFTAIDGMNSIGKYLSRWVDVKTNTRAGGLTYFGKNRSRKRTWMINLTSRDTFEADAVIIALPAPQAYGIINSTIDETNTLKMVRVINDIEYKPCYSLMLGYGESADLPAWQGVVCQKSWLDFISNETSKRESSSEAAFVLHASESFTKQNRQQPEDVVQKKMIQEFAKIAGSWVLSPEWQQLHFWRLSRAKKFLEDPYLEHADPEAPLALIGDYFRGNTIDHAYTSGYRLAKDWIDKYNK